MRPTGRNHSQGEKDIVHLKARRNLSSNAKLLFFPENFQEKIVNAAAHVQCFRARHWKSGEVVETPKI